MEKGPDFLPSFNPLFPNSCYCFARLSAPGLPVKCSHGNSVYDYVHSIKDAQALQAHGIDLSPLLLLDHSHTLLEWLLQHPQVEIRLEDEAKIIWRYEAVGTSQAVKTLLDFGFDPRELCDQDLAAPYLLRHCRLIPLISLPWELANLVTKYCGTRCYRACRKIY